MKPDFLPKSREVEKWYILKPRDGSLRKSYLQFILWLLDARNTCRIQCEKNRFMNTELLSDLWICYYYWKLNVIQCMTLNKIISQNTEMPNAHLSWTNSYRIHSAESIEVVVFLNVNGKEKAKSVSMILRNEFNTTLVCGRNFTLTVIEFWFIFDKIWLWAG